MGRVTLYVHGRPARQVRARRRTVAVLGTLVGIALVGSAAALLVHSARTPPAVDASGPSLTAIAAGPGPVAGGGTPAPEATGLDPEHLAELVDVAGDALARLHDGRRLPGVEQHLGVGSGRGLVRPLEQVLGAIRDEGEPIFPC